MRCADPAYALRTECRGSPPPPVVTLQCTGMNITFLSTLPIGHAVELTVAVPAGMLGWHVRRRQDDQFPADPDRKSVV